MSDSNSRLLPALIAVQFLTLIMLTAMFFRLPPRENLMTGDTMIEDKPVQEPAFPASRLPAAELKDALREIVREELAALPASTETTRVNTQQDKILSENERQEQETAAAISVSIVQQATSAGVWRRTDTEALLPHLGKLSEEHRLALTKQLFSSINRQELAMEDFPPL